MQVMVKNYKSVSLCFLKWYDDRNKRKHKEEKEMFTRMSKGLLIFMEVALVIGSIVGGCALGAASEAPGFGFFMILVFLLASFIILCSFGLFVELANNILDIKRILEKQNKGYASSVSKQNNSQENNVAELNQKHEKTNVDRNNNYTNTISEHGDRIYENNEVRISLDDLANMAAQADEEQRLQQGWFCSECGTKNPAGAITCKACGKEKYNN